MIDYTTLSQEVTCHRCRWRGTVGQLQFTLNYTPSKLYASIYNVWDESHKPCCPACRSINIVYKEDSNAQ